MVFEPWQDMAFLLGHVRVFLKSVLSVFFFFYPLFRRLIAIVWTWPFEEAGLECVLAV